MIYRKHMLLCSIWIGPRVSILTECWVCPDIFSWYLCTRRTSKVFSHLPLNRRSRIFSPACNMSFLSDNGNEKIINRFWNSWLFQIFCNTLRDPTERNFDVVLQPQNACIARIDCVNLLPSNCLDFLISIVVLLELQYKCTGWYSDEL